MRTNNSNHYHHPHRHEMERRGEEGNYPNKLHSLLSSSSSFSSSSLSSFISHPSLTLHRGHRFPTDNKNVFFFITLNRVELVKGKGKFSLPSSESVDDSRLERRREKNRKEVSNHIMPNNNNNNNSSGTSGNPVYYHLTPHGEWEGTLVSSSIIIFEASTTITTTTTTSKTTTNMHEQQHTSTFIPPFSSDTFPGSAKPTSSQPFPTSPPPSSTGSKWKAEGMKENNSAFPTSSSNNSSRRRRTSSTLINGRKGESDVDRKEGMKENRRGGNGKGKGKGMRSVPTHLSEVSSSFDFSHEEDPSGRDVVPSPSTVNGDYTEENSSVSCLGHNRSETAPFHPEGSVVSYEFQNSQHTRNSYTHHHHRYLGSNSDSRTGSKIRMERGEKDAEMTAVLPPYPTPNRDSNNNNNSGDDGRSTTRKSASASRRHASPFPLGLSSFSSQLMSRFPGRKNNKRGEDAATMTHSDDRLISSRNLSSSSSSSASEAGDHNAVTAAGSALKSLTTSSSCTSKEGRRERHKADQSNDYAAQHLLPVRYEGEREEEHSVTSKRTTSTADEKKKKTGAVAQMMNPTNWGERKGTGKNTRGRNITVQQFSYQTPFLPYFVLSPVPFTSRYLETSSFYSSSSSSSRSSSSSSFRSSSGIHSSPDLSRPTSRPLIQGSSSSSSSPPPRTPLKDRDNLRLSSSTSSCTSSVLEYITKGVPYTMYVLDEKGESGRGGRGGAAAKGVTPIHPGRNEEERRNGGVPLSALPSSFSSSSSARQAHHLQYQQEKGVREEQANHHPHGHYPTPMPSDEGNIWEDNRRPPSSMEWDMLHFLCLGKEGIREKNADRGHPIEVSPGTTTVAIPSFSVSFPLSNGRKTSSLLSSPISSPFVQGRKMEVQEKKEDTRGGGAAAAITTSYAGSHLPPPLPLPPSSTSISILTSGPTKKRRSSLFSQNNGGNSTLPPHASTLQPTSSDPPTMTGIHQNNKKIDKKKKRNEKKNRGRERRSTSMEEMGNHSNHNIITPYDLSHDNLFLSVSSTQPPLTPFQCNSSETAKFNITPPPSPTCSSFFTSSGGVFALPESFLMSWSCLTPRPMRLTFLAVHLASLPSAGVSSSSLPWLPSESGEGHEGRSSADHGRNSTTLPSPVTKGGGNALTVEYNKNKNEEEEEEEENHHHYVDPTTLGDPHSGGGHNAPSSPSPSVQEGVMTPVLECMIDEVLCVLTHAVVTVDHHTSKIFSISLEGNSIECVNPINPSKEKVEEKQKGNQEQDVQNEFIQQQRQEQNELGRELKEYRNEGVRKCNISPSPHTFTSKKGTPETHPITSAGPGEISEEKYMFSHEKNGLKELHGADVRVGAGEWGGGEDRRPQWGRGKSKLHGLEKREEMEFRRHHRNFEVMIGDFRREVIYV